MKFFTGRDRRGFTLLEVMVAMTIVGLGVVTLLQVFSSGLRLGSRSNAHTEATAQSARIMDELIARPNLSDGSQSGRLAAGGQWRAQVQALRDATPALNLRSNWELKEVGLELILADGDRERRVELKTLRLARKGNP